MQMIVEQLNKLRGRSLGELSVRGQQQLSKFGDRWLRRQAREMDDHALYREFNRDWRNGSAVGTAEMWLRQRRAASRLLLSVFAQRALVARMMRQRFARQREEIIARAERAIRGRFDLLGLTNLSFGDPIDWHLDPCSGARAPVIHWSKLDSASPVGKGDPKIVWELNRHAHFVTLGQAYWLTEDERFVTAFIQQADAWMDANPPAMGVNWVSSLEAAFRSIAWIWALQLCAGSPQLTAEFIARLIKSLIAHGRYIETYLSHYYSPNTHLTGEALGLLYLGLALPELRRAKSWRETGLRILLGQMPKQVRDDGVYFEQASYYHRYTADFYTHLWLLARAHRIALPTAVERRLTSLLDHLMWITRPDGTSPLFGDDDGGRLITLGARSGNDFRDTLATGAAIFGRADWKYAAGDAAVETLWLTGVEGTAGYDQIKATPPLETARAFDQSGYFVMRNGWAKDSSVALVDCGLHGAQPTCGHAHADALAIEFCANGVTWLVDPGTFVYGADPKTRDEFRSTAAHNTVTVDGAPQSQPRASFAWATIAESQATSFSADETGLHFEGWHNGYHRLADPVTHARAVTLVKTDAAQSDSAQLIVRDRFTAQGHHRYQIRYHLAAGCRAEITGDCVEARHEAGEMLSISVSGDAPILARVETGWVSTCYAQRTPAPVAVFETEGAGQLEFTTRFTATKLDRPNQLSIHQANENTPCGQGPSKPQPLSEAQQCST